MNELPRRCPVAHDVVHPATFTPKPGDLGLVPFGGRLGWIITLLQATLAGRPSRWSHTFVVLPGGWTISAQPGGARRLPLAEATKGKRLAYMPVPEWGNRDAIVDWAIEHEGVPYSFASYLWIGLARLHIRPGWLRRRVGSEAAMICSAFGDRAWMAGGVHCFDDGRVLGGVAPGDLAYVGLIVNVNTGPYRS